MKVRPVIVDGEVAIVTLTRGKVAIVDAVDAPLVAGRNWHALPNNTNWYAATTVLNADGTRVTLLMHRLFAESAAILDHRDGDGLNNRRGNLRPATHGQNMQNRRRTTNRHGLKGVVFDAKRGKYRAVVADKGRRVSLGRYETAEAAAAAYDIAAVRLYGEFAATNQSLGLL